MKVRIKFKELVITEAVGIGETCDLVEKRNPDIKIDEAYEDT
jgi:hypothetical protein